MGTYNSRPATSRTSSNLFEEVKDLKVLRVQLLKKGYHYGVRADLENGAAIVLDKTTDSCRICGDGLMNVHYYFVEGQPRQWKEYGDVKIATKRPTVAQLYSAGRAETYHLFEDNCIDAANAMMSCSVDDYEPMVNPFF